MSKKSIAIIVILAMICIMITPISAYYVTYVAGSAYRIIGIKNDLSSTYGSALTAAIDSWNSGLEKREIRVISSGVVNSITDLDFRDTADMSNLSFLFAERFISSGMYKAWSVDTTTCCSNHQARSFIIYLNTYLLNSSSSEHAKQATIAHELGHALGLDDYENLANYRDHIMNYATNKETYYTPHSSEISGVNTYWNH